MGLRFLFLVTVLVWGFGEFILPPNVNGQSPILKNQGGSLTTTGSGGVSMRVLWTITTYKVGDGAVWGKEEADKMLFKPLDLDSKTITFDGKVCRDVIFKKERVNAKKYLGQVYHTTPRIIGIEDEVFEVVKTNCHLPGFSEYIRLGDRRLVIHINGVFFFLEPAVNY